MRERTPALVIGAGVLLAGLVVAIRSGGNRAAGAAPDPTHEARSAPADQGSAEGEHAPEAPLVARAPERVAAAEGPSVVAGRLVVRGGGPPPSNAFVTVRTDREDLDFPETVAA